MAKDTRIDQTPEKKIEKMSFFKKYKDKIIGFLSNITEIVFYGFLINYMLSGIFGLPFNLYTFPAYGIAYYFIMEELQLLIAKLFHKR